MNSLAGPVISLLRSGDVPAARERRGLWFYYRNARMWGKPLLWSIRYARQARLKFN